MKFILLRHGKTEEEEKKIILGWQPGTLSAEGKEQAKSVANLIKSIDLNPELVISSDLARAADYAAIIASQLGLKVKLEPLLRERRGGEIEGKMESEVDWQEYEKAPRLTRKHPGGESFEDVRRRAQKFLKGLNADSQFRTVIMVSHSVFLAMLVMEIYGWGLERALDHDFRRPSLVDTDKKNIEFVK